MLSKDLTLALLLISAKTPLLLVVNCHEEVADFSLLSQTDPSMMWQNMSNSFHPTIASWHLSAIGLPSHVEGN
jgi:hypothetical protein